MSDTVAVDALIYGVREAANLAASIATRTRPVAYDIAGLAWKRTVLIGLGQSLGVGAECWPALTTDALYGNLTLGGSVRSGGDPASGAFVPLGPAEFRPHEEMVQAFPSFAPLSDAAVSALPAADKAHGETYLGAAAATLKAAWSARWGRIGDTTRRLVSIQSGAGSKTVAQISAGTVYWSEMVDHAVDAKATADAGRTSSGVAALIYAQGENDYAAGTSAESWKASFLAGIYQPFRSAIAAGVFGQSLRPLVVFAGVSPGARTDGLAIDMAQSDLAREHDDIVIACPTYHVPDKGIHLTSNGSRWIGSHVGRVLHRVLADRMQWRPLEPRWESAGGPAWRSGRSIAIDFHVPEPPLAWGRPFDGRTAVDVVQQGFRAVDSAGPIGCAPRLVFSTIVEIVLDREPVGPVTVTYAGSTGCAGLGGLCDSDPYMGPLAYEYRSGSGQYADEDIAALVGRPYPGANWCLPFRLTV